MFRALARLGSLAAVLVAALAFSGNALANPTTPQLAPIPSTVFGSPLTVSWSPSFWDAGSILRFYELQVIDLTAGTSSTQAVFATSKTLNVAYNHTYGVRLRAANVVGGYLKYSGSDVDVFTVLQMPRIPLFYERLYPWDPQPWCLTCPPIEILFGDDPVVQDARRILATSRVLDREAFGGFYVDALGEVTAVQR